MLYGVQMLYGSEVNLLADGILSLDQRHLNFLDYAIVGIHGPCYENQGLVKNTDNLLRAMENPKVRLVSHPDDDHFPLDYVALVQGAKATATALEVNNSSLRKPHLRPGCRENYRKMLPLCMEYGVDILVNTDAAKATATALEVNNSSLRKPHLRPGCRENYRKMLPLCMEYGVDILVNTDAHDPDAVGDFTLARQLLEEIGVDETRILNTNLQRMRNFLLD